jgi:K+-transporting ATPase ATPase C chain
MIKEHLKPAFLLFVSLTLVTGVIYPLLVTGIAQTLFHNEANGSVIFQEGKPVGSDLIGQTFDDPKYLWGRPSATGPSYNGAASSGSNYGPLNPGFLDSVKVRLQTLKDADPSNSLPIPVDLVTASGSGLDPHISLAAAYYQVSRIAKAREIEEETIKEIISKNTQKRFLGLLGEPVVNVLKVNLELDDLNK